MGHRENREWDSQAQRDQRAKQARKVLSQVRAVLTAAPEALALKAQLAPLLMELRSLLSRPASRRSRLS